MRHLRLTIPCPRARAHVWIPTYAAGSRTPSSGCSCTGARCHSVSPNMRLAVELPLQPADHTRSLYRCARRTRRHAPTNQPTAMCCSGLIHHNHTHLFLFFFFRRRRGDRDLVPTHVYNDFDIILDHFPRVFQLHPTPHAPWAVLYLVPSLTSC